METTMEKVETHVAVVGTLESEGLGPTGMVWLGGNNGNHTGKSGTHVVVVGTLESERLGPTGMVWLLETQWK